MAVTKSHTGVVTVAMHLRELISGDKRGLGEVLNASKSNLFLDANLDGWFAGTGTISRSNGIAYTNIILGNTDPLGALGAGTFNQGFTSNGKYCPLTYWELLTNTTASRGTKASRVV